MAQNLIQRGDVLDYTNGGSTTIASGTPILIGVRLGIAMTDIAPGQVGAVRVQGVFSVPKDAEAISQGEQLYWDAAHSAATGTAGSNVPVGWAFASAASGDATVKMKLLQ